MKEVKLKDCRNEGCNNQFKQYKTTDKYCSFGCAADNKKEAKKPVYSSKNKKSKKQIVIDAKYGAQRIIYLGKPENKTCFVEGCNKQANTVEHRAGRGGGFFDNWAREKNIPKTLDERYWAPCCLEHNLEFETNPELSKKYQLSKLHYGKKI